MGAAVAVPIIASIVGGGLSFIQQRSAAKKAESIGRENAARERAEAGEALRRLEITQQRNLGTARARAGASGFDVTGGDTMGEYIDELGSQYEAELDWLRRSGASRASIAEREGQLAADTARASGWGSLFEGIGSGARWWAGS